MRNVLVVGAGLAGLAIAALLARSGATVTVAEAQSEPGTQPARRSRSINLALSARGLRTIHALGLTQAVQRRVVPMYGRCVHGPDGTSDLQPYDLVGTQANLSIRRSELWDLLRACAEQSGATLLFDRRCAGIDFAARIAAFATSAGQTDVLGYDALIGADGAHSAVRRALAEAGLAGEQIHMLRHGYVELHIPKEVSADLPRHALHIWPRGERMLIALPNTDGTFTATLFVPGEARPHDLPASFRRQFPEALGLLPDMAVELPENPFSRLTAIRCTRWTDGRGALLIGDAAHTMAPFHGQGMNCALEDCTVLIRSIERCGDWPNAFADFERVRRADAEAIAALSEANYAEMSRKVVEGEFRLRREIERALQTRFPQRFMPLYAMIAFTTIPYAEALAHGAAQDAVVDRLAGGLRRIADLDFARAEILLPARVPAPQ